MTLSPPDAIDNPDRIFSISLWAFLIGSVIVGVCMLAFATISQIFLAEHPDLNKALLLVLIVGYVGVHELIHKWHYRFVDNEYDPAVRWVSLYTIVPDQQIEIKHYQQNLIAPFVCLTVVIPLAGAVLAGVQTFGIATALSASYLVFSLLVINTAASVIDLYTAWGVQKLRVDPDPYNYIYMIDEKNRRSWFLPSSHNYRTYAYRSPINPVND